MYEFPKVRRGPCLVNPSGQPDRFLRVVFLTPSLTTQCGRHTVSVLVIVGTTLGNSLAHKLLGKKSSTRRQRWTKTNTRKTTTAMSLKTATIKTTIMKTTTLMTTTTKTITPPHYQEPLWEFKFWVALFIAMLTLLLRIEKERKPTRLSKSLEPKRSTWRVAKKQNWAQNPTQQRHLNDQMFTMGWWSLRKIIIILNGE